MFKDFIDFLHKQKEFSEKTFGPAYSWPRIVEHIKKELDEISAEPESINEWIDVMFLAFDGARRAGHDPEQIVLYMLEKQKENENRKWPPWQIVDPQKPIEHIKENPDSVEKECPICYALIDVSRVAKFALVECHGCNLMLEFDGVDLIAPEGLD